MITTGNVQPERKKQAEIDIGLSSILDSQDFQQEMCNYAKAGDFSHVNIFCEIQTIQRFIPFLCLPPVEHSLSKCRFLGCHIKVI